MTFSALASPLTLLRQLIPIPSVNPRLGTDPAVVGEARVTDWLQAFCTQHDWAWLRQPVHPGRDNLVAWIPGEAGPPLLWEAHQDTVSASGMTIDPWGAEIRAGRVYGRGACDVKGGMAALLASATQVAGHPVAERRPLILAFTINEECGFSGVTQLARIWSTRDPLPSDADQTWPATLKLGDLQRRRPAAALIAEPTDLNVVVAHRGVVRWQCHAVGRAVHSSQPEAGANAVYAIAEAIRALRSYDRDVLARSPADPLCGRATLCVTTVSGGQGPNTVPEAAMIDIDRRLAPTEDPRDAYALAVQFVEDSGGDFDQCRLVHEPPWLASSGLAHDANRDWGEQLAAYVRRHGASGEVVGVPYGTNAARLAAAGIPAVVFGPGSIAQAHTSDEWIEIAALEQATKILTTLALEA